MKIFALQKSTSILHFAFCILHFTFLISHSAFCISNPAFRIKMQAGIFIQSSQYLIGIKSVLKSTHPPLTRSPFSYKRRLNVCFIPNYCQKLNICEPSPVGEGVKRSLTDEESREKDNFQSLPCVKGGAERMRGGGIVFYTNQLAPYWY